MVILSQSPARSGPTSKATFVSSTPIGSRAVGCWAVSLEWNGQRQCRDDEVAPLKDNIEVLEDINTYAWRFAHDNPEQTTETAVQSYIGKAFDMVRG